MTSIVSDWIAFVAGSPVTHSLSPAIHSAALRLYGRLGVYGSLECGVDEVSRVWDQCRRQGMVGASVTMPLKEVVVAGCDALSPSAQVLGAVNCLAVTPSGLVGHNTDGEGCAAALVNAGAALDSNDFAVVLGAGGTARAVALALASRGVRVTFVSRTREKAEMAAGRIAAAANVAGQVTVGSMADVADATVIVNATPVGMGSNESPVPSEVLPTGVVVLDAVYHPLETTLLRQARAAGATPVDGLWMLVEQARLQQEIWFGEIPDGGVMRRAAEDQLAGRQ